MSYVPDPGFTRNTSSCEGLPEDCALVALKHTPLSGSHLNNKKRFQTETEAYGTVEPSLPRSPARPAHSPMSSMFQGKDTAYCLTFREKGP